MRLADTSLHSHPEMCYRPAMSVSASVCVCVREWLWVSPFILLWLPLLPLTCHPCSMTACRRWPGMVWNMEYPWAKLDCKTACFLHTRHDAQPLPTYIHLYKIHSFRHLSNHMQAQILHEKLCTPSVEHDIAYNLLCSLPFTLTVPVFIQQNGFLHELTHLSRNRPSVTPYVIQFFVLFCLLSKLFK